MKSQAAEIPKTCSTAGTRAQKPEQKGRACLKRQHTAPIPRAAHLPLLGLEHLSGCTHVRLESSQSCTSLWDRGGQSFVSSSQRSQKGGRAGQETHGPTSEGKERPESKPRWKKEREELSLFVKYVNRWNSSTLLSNKGIRHH